MLYISVWNLRFFFNYDQKYIFRKINETIYDNHDIYKWYMTIYIYIYIIYTFFSYTK